MKIQHVSYGQRIRDLALSFPETYEDAPWGHPVFKVGDNKMFASMSDGDDPVSVTLKLTPEEREALATKDYGKLYALGAHPFTLWSFTEAVWAHERPREELVADYKAKAAKAGYPNFKT